MANQAQYKQLREQTEASLSRIHEANPESYIREKELGSLSNFKEIEGLINKILNLYGSINIEDVIDLPFDLQRAFTNHLNDALQRLQELAEYDPNQNNAQRRTQLINNIESNYGNYYTHTLPVLVNKLLTGNDLEGRKGQLDNFISEYKSRLNKDATESQEKLQQIEKVLQNVEDSAAESGVVKYAELFADESSDHETKATKWLQASFWLIGIVIVAATLLILLFPDEESSTGEIVQYTITKVIILSSLFIALSICTRNYKAHKHNAVLNKHRQNALSTFETFVSAAGEDEPTKNAVLLEATHTIFSNQQTGYLMNGNDNEGPNKIVEIFKNVSSKPE
ncbi:hypothetical protein K6119_07930 [Paracrocinitomix mangrovi]|uniref:hypothetical protein n=1 Tax=Paracrocinitomix mangrovi TaxID=2862509 RepID=UPI001C8EA454|nr:hypothetical protein [Paracrocinitomix mangrovi]UKN03440.1 hypothetical protein K6119_07930 [Paracrocinitomix mangrovi]